MTATAAARLAVLELLASKGVRAWGVRRAKTRKLMPMLSEEERFRVLVESITDYAVFMLEPDGTIASWNAGAKRFKGYDPEEVIGRHFSIFYTPADREAGLPERALATAAEQGHFESEGWRVRKDGSRFWTHVVIDPIRNSSGELIGYAKITRDLTERKNAEEALRRSEEQFKLLVQGVTDYAIYMLDPGGSIVSWNSGAEHIKGYSPDEVIGKHFSIFYPEEARERGDPEFGLQLAAERGRFEREGWRVRKDGSRFWASVVIDAIRDERGQLAGFAKVTRDITERMEAQRELERTREALFQAQKMEAIGQLTGGVAHDFNNLLTVILSSLDLLQRRLPEDERLHSLVENARQATERGASLTKRMLAFARQQELDRRAVDLLHLVRDMGDLLQRSVGPQIQIETRFPISVPPVYTDANQLETALLNLALNARDAMPNGGTLTLGAREVAVTADHPGQLDPGHYVLLIVSDDGEGMDAETLARATDPFFTTKGVGKGTGLGLSMVQGFAEQGGGSLTLKSKKGAGSTVELWLPVAKESMEQEVSDQALASHQTDSGRALRILVVDDDRLVLRNTAALLEDMGHTVTTAESGADGLSYLREGVEFDLVITDQAMPQMTGVQLAEAIHAIFPKLPIIVATGYADIADEILPTLPRLSKPFTRKQLAEAVHNLVKAFSGVRDSAKFLRAASTAV